MLKNGPENAQITIILAHGAGAGMDTVFMHDMASQLAQAGLGVLRFEFPYMQKMRAEGRRRPPDRLPVLQSAYRDVVSACGETKIVIGGKSMGGRVASTVADELAVAGLVCLGYPFHPPGKPDRLRTAHLKDLTTPTLIVQGSRDPFGSRDEVNDYQLSPAIRQVWLEDGDHSFKPRKASGHTLEGHLKRAADEMVAFCQLL